MEIPEISDEELNERYETIKPVLRFAEVTFGGRTTHETHNDGDLYYIQDVDPRRTAFNLDPKPTEKAHGLTELDRVKTYHTSGGFFHKPSVAEVLAQIPVCCIEDVVAFETVDPYVDRTMDYSVATTILYRNKLVEEVDQEIEFLKKQRDALSKTSSDK
jgi:hypothetical protein